MFDPIKKQRAFEQVAEGLKAHIFDGTLKAGDKLPSEAVLARNFSVGRQTIREALRFLEISGFISTQNGGAGGIRIQDEVIPSITKAFMNATKLKKVTVEEVLDIRLEMEGLVIKKVIENATPSELRNLKELLEVSKRKIKSATYTGLENIQFHKVLAEASRNKALAILMDLIMAVLDYFITADERGYDRMRAEIKAHGQILEAIVARDEKRAFEHLRKHVSGVQRRIKE